MKYRVECWDCGGDGWSHGFCTCGEDCCCCMEPEPPACDTCRGKGYLVVDRLTDDNCDTAVPVHGD